MLVVLFVCMSQYTTPAPFKSIETVVTATVYELALLAAKSVISFISPASVLHIILGRVGVLILRRIISYIIA